MTNKTYAGTFVDVLNKDTSLFGKAKITAQAIDPTVYCAWTDHILFYYFADGSKAGLLHKKKQVWEAKHIVKNTAKPGQSGSWLEVPQE